MARQITTAAAVPIQTCRRASRRPSWPRKAAMIPTISAASRPSRSPITNVGSTRGPPYQLVIGWLVRLSKPNLGIPNNTRRGPVKILSDSRRDIDLGKACLIR